LWLAEAVIPAGFLLIGLVYVNMVKCVTEWTKERVVGGGSFRSVPEVMKMPFVVGWNQPLCFSAPDGT
jgi:hypothetical protein